MKKAVMLLGLLLVATLGVFVLAGFNSSIPPNLGPAYGRKVNLTEEEQKEYGVALFSPYLDAGESFDEAKLIPHYFWQGERVTRSNHRDKIDRALYWGTLELTEDQAIADFVNLEIEKDSKLVIAKGVTLTVNGTLLVKGTLENHGTIIVGKPGLKKAYEDAGPICSQIINNADFKSDGTIVIRCGGIINSADGKLQNSGIITIENQEEGLIGIHNERIKKSSGFVGGTLLNTGEINVKNVGGTGVKIDEDCEFKNDGKIYLFGSATVKGSIQGNKPVRK